MEIQIGILGSAKRTKMAAGQKWEMTWIEMPLGISQDPLLGYLQMVKA